MGIFSLSFRQANIPTLKYFLVVAAELNFLHSFLSIPPDVLGLILKFQIFFEKLALFHARELDHICDQYSSIVPIFDYLRVATVQ